MDAEFQSHEKSAKKRNVHDTEQLQDSKYALRPMLSKSSDSVHTDALTSSEQRLMDSEMKRPANQTPVNLKQ